MKLIDPFPRLLHAFFYEWMVQQRNASVHTVRSYRDTWRLFLRFVAQRRRRPVVQFILADLTASEVKAFLQYTEQERGDTIGTRNCRLSALRSFFGFVADREPSAIEQCTQVLHVPMKKAPIHAPCYLEPEEVKAILAQPDRSTIEGQRDHALFSFLYNTGARIQEALDVRPRAIRFDSPACVRLYGKGRKERLSPLWPETVTLIRSQLQRQPRADDEPIFVNRYGVPLSASGARFKLAEYVEAATQTAPSLASKRVTPHSFRHATAVHLVAAGVDVTVIRSWLGHVSLDTTSHYAQANLETKRLALERLESPSRSAKRPSWKQDQSVLAWLDTL
jgi:site-specific recombinase XerD